MTRRKPKSWKQQRRRISDILTLCAIIVLLLCAIFFIKTAATHVRSTKIANELRHVYYSTLPSSASADAVNISTSESAPLYVLNLPTITAAPQNESPVQTKIQDMAFPEDRLLVVSANATLEPMMPVVNDIVRPTTVPNVEPVLQDRFVDLYQQNSDLVGWIHVNDKIDYPLVWRKRDNDYYMNHDFNGNHSDAGWIFLDKRNGEFMDDDSLLIYGHNMRLGNMFGELDRYRSLNFVKQNPIIELQSAWETESRKYVIVSVFDASMDKDHSTYIKITNFNFKTDEDKQSYIDQVYHRSILDLPCETSVDDQLITLVTCSYTLPNGRLLVVARELHEDETVEQIERMFADL